MKFFKRNILKEYERCALECVKDSGKWRLFKKFFAHITKRQKIKDYVLEKFVGVVYSLAKYSSPMMDEEEL